MHTGYKTLNTLNSPSHLFSHIIKAHLNHDGESSEQKAIAEILIKRWNKLKTDPGISFDALKQETGEIDLSKVVDPQKSANKKCIFTTRGQSKDYILVDDDVEVD